MTKPLGSRSQLQALPDPPAPLLCALLQGLSDDWLTVGEAAHPPPRQKIPR